MAEEQVNTPQAEQNSETNPSTQADNKNDVPYTRFQEVNQKMRSIESELIKEREEKATLKAEKEEARQKSLKDKEEYKTLYEEVNSELGSVKEQNEAYKKRELEDRERMVEKVPEDQRVFTEGMSNSVLAQYIEQNQTSANAGKTDSSRAGTTAKGEFNGYSSYAEWATKDPKGYEEVNGIVGNAGQGFNVGG